jgi:hypothetical protein
MLYLIRNRTECTAKRLWGEISRSNVGRRLDYPPPTHVIIPERGMKGERGGGMEVVLALQALIASACPVSKILILCAQTPFSPSYRRFFYLANPAALGVLALIDKESLLRGITTLA